MGLSRLLKLLFSVIFTIICLQYFLTVQYQFPEPLPFEGDSLYNPYAGCGNKWLKSNFHAHSFCWGGIVNGHQAPDSIVSHYKRELGYDVACISNYHKNTRLALAQKSQYFPIYEHGYNIRKVHQLVIGSDEVCFHDIALFQSLHNKQYLIEHEKENSRIVAILHPGIRDAYTDEDLQKLSGYDLLEVLNHNKNAEAKWDVALSAGKIPWIIANDDCHDISLENETGVSWTMINSGTVKSAEIMNSLASGKAYGVTGSQARNEHYLKDVTVQGNTVCFKVDGIAQEIVLIGQNGMVRKTFANSDSALYTFQPEDHYIRAVIKFPQLTMYLNPIIRFNGKGIPNNTMAATEDILQTMLFRLLISVIWVSGIYFVLNAKRSRWWVPVRPRRIRRFPDPSTRDVGMV